MELTGVIQRTDSWWHHNHSHYMAVDLSAQCTYWSVHHRFVAYCLAKVHLSPSWEDTVA